MGIDVRQYAMANQDVKHAAWVGCGMCAHISGTPHFSMTCAASRST
jgi:hypothetical protein